MSHLHKSVSYIKQAKNGVEAIFKRKLPSIQRCILVARVKSNENYNFLKIHQIFFNRTLKDGSIMQRASRKSASFWNVYYCGTSRLNASDRAIAIIIVFLVNIELNFECSLISKTTQEGFLYEGRVGDYV